MNLAGVRRLRVDAAACVCVFLGLACSAQPEPSTGIRVNQSGIASRMVATGDAGSQEESRPDEQPRQPDVAPPEQPRQPGVASPGPRPAAPSAERSGERVRLRRVEHADDRRRPTPRPDPEIAENVKPRRPDHFERIAID